MDGDINEALDNLIQLGREADATSIKVGVICSGVARVKQYPQGTLVKYHKTFTKMRGMIEDVASEAIKIHDKLFSIYATLKEEYPEVETPKPRRKRLPDGAIDITRRGRKLVASKPKKKKFDMEDMM